jgi:hypothetical protein
MSTTSEKPVRVANGTVQVFTCPACQEAVMGTVTVAIHLGPMDLGYSSEGGQEDDQITMAATVPVVTETRGLSVRHDCNTKAAQ